jgi:hypothetical protein
VLTDLAACDLDDGESALGVPDRTRFKRKDCLPFSRARKKSTSRSEISCGASETAPQLKLDAVDRHQTNVLSRSKVTEHRGNDGYHALH